MVSLEKIRADMQHLLERDKQLHNVDVHAESIDEALADAAVQLDTKAEIGRAVQQEGRDRSRMPSSA